MKTDNFETEQAYISFSGRNEIIGYAVDKSVFDTILDMLDTWGACLKIWHDDEN